MSNIPFLKSNTEQKNLELVGISCLLLLNCLSFMAELKLIRCFLLTEKEIVPGDVPSGNCTRCCLSEHIWLKSSTWKWSLKPEKYTHLFSKKNQIETSCCWSYHEGLAASGSNLSVISYGGRRVLSDASLLMCQKSSETDRCSHLQMIVLGKLREWSEKMRGDKRVDVVCVQRRGRWRKQEKSPKKRRRFSAWADFQLKLRMNARV